MRCTKPRQPALNENFNLRYGSHVKKHDTRLLIGRIAFLTCGKSDTRHLIGLHRFANENLLCGFSVCKSQYVYNKSWFWLKKGSVKRETESLIMAAQEQALATNLMKARIYQTQEDSKCRMCRKVDGSINHIVSECPKLAQKEYKRRHDCVGKKIHWEVCKWEGFIVNEKWYEHVPEPVLENERCKILWDFTIQTDHVIEAGRPDMIVVEKRNKYCKIYNRFCNTM